MLPNELCIRIFGWLSPRDLCMSACCCKHDRRLANSNLLWRSLYTDRFGAAPLSVVAGARSESLAFWKQLTKRKLCREVEILIVGLMGKKLRLEVPIATNKYELKQWIRREQLKLDGYTFEDFDLVDADGNRFESCRGSDNLLPPATWLMLVGFLDWELLPPSGFTTWRREMRTRNREWQVDLASVADGIVLTQTLFAKRGRGRREEVGLEPNESMPIDIAAVLEACATKTECFKMLRLGGVQHLLGLVTNSRVSDAVRSEALDTLITLVDSSQRFLVDECGTAAWKVAGPRADWLPVPRGLFIHPLLSVALQQSPQAALTPAAGEGQCFTTPVRRRALLHWFMQTGRAVRRRWAKIFCNAMIRGAITWGSPIILATLFFSVWPNLIAVHVRTVNKRRRWLLEQIRKNNFRMIRGWWGFRTLSRGAGESVSWSALKLATRVTLSISVVSAPYCLVAALYETLHVVVDNIIWEHEGGKLVPLPVLTMALLLVLSSAMSVVRSVLALSVAHHWKPGPTRLMPTLSRYAASASHLPAAALARTVAMIATASKGSVLQLLGSAAAAVGSWTAKSVSMNIKSHRALGLGWSFRALVLQFCASAAIWKCGESAVSSGAAARLTTLPLYGYSVPIFAIWGYARLQFLLED